ncbi:hypothetical protein EVAR_85260_1 [Eumeta japonica]|uniref:Uncharacterized protein n=1 Tax=Eumeta variegata TaxID=151549 RepID=A0A4C1V7L0_EUMVA|nr:hypothetical protein EVAR_85260_1 [Eumeta japonica]
MDRSRFLYSLYSNDVPRHSKVELTLFADDTALYTLNSRSRAPDTSKQQSEFSATGSGSGGSRFINTATGAPWYVRNLNLHKHLGLQTIAASPQKSNPNDSDDSITFVIKNYSFLHQANTACPSVSLYRRTRRLRPRTLPSETPVKPTDVAHQTRTFKPQIRGQPALPPFPQRQPKPKSVYLGSAFKQLLKKFLLLECNVRRAQNVQFRCESLRARN